MARQVIGWGVLLLLVAFGLRIAGIDYGQPVAPERDGGAPFLNAQVPIHPDEYFYVSIPLQMHLQGRLNPQFYENPSLLIYANYLTYALGDNVSAIAQLDWQSRSLRELAPFPLYVIGRVYSVLGGLLAVAGTVAAARLLAGRWAALTAGLVAAFSLPLIQHAHYTTTTSLATGFGAVSLWAALAALRTEGRHRWLYVLAAIMGGLAAGSRYNAAAYALPVFVAGLLLLWRQVPGARLSVGLGWAALPLTFLLTTPGILFDFSEFWRQFTFIYSRYSFGEAVGFFEALYYEYRYIILFGLGIPGALAAVIGLGALASDRRRWADSALLLAFIVPYSIVVLDTPVPEISDQLTVVALPPWIVLAGAGLVALTGRLRWRYARGILLVGTLVMPVMLGLTAVTLFTTMDTRYEAQRWISDHVPGGTRIFLLGPYNVPLNLETYSVEQRFVDFPSPEDLRAEGFEIVVVSDALAFFRARLGHLPQAEREALAQLWSDYTALPQLYVVPRPRWWGDTIMPNNLSYWHHPAIHIYCLTERACAVGQASVEFD